MPERKVEERDHLALLAHVGGFADSKPLLADPRNAAIAARRPHPNILEPDETVFIPDWRPKSVSVATNQEHKLVVRRIRSELRLKLAGFLGARLDVASAEAQIDGSGAKPVTVGGDGSVKLPIPIETWEVVLSVTLKDDEAIEWTCRVGARRAEHEPGAIDRLQNLGYYRTVEPERQVRERRSAIEEFQHEHQLPLSGELDAATTQKLINVHGS